MSSDVEMSESFPLKKISSKISSPTPPPPLSSRTSSVSLPDTPHPISHDPKRPSLIHTLLHPTPEHNPKPPTAPSTSAKPASHPKPKSSKPRPRSRSPSPPPPPPPLQTIRIEIKLGGPDSYEVDIASIAKATGQRPPTPVQIKRDTSDSEGDDEGDGKDGKDKPKPKKKKKNLTTEYYDLTDNFIDDSELAVDERTYFGQTKQQGFYVSSGEVALVKDKTPKKPKSKKIISEAGPSTLTSAKQEGTRDAPIALTSDGEDDRPGHKRKRYITVVEGGKKRKIVDVHSFHPELQAAIDVLKDAISKESWETKGKFPPAIKPVLTDVAVKAIELNEYDEHFFNLMPTLFPYNKFTMTKLIKRTVFLDHTQILMQHQEKLLKELAELTTSGFAKAQEEWEKSVVAWEKKQEKAKAEAEAPSPSNADSTSAGGLARQTTEDAGSGADQDHPAPAHDKDGAGKDPGKEAHPPSRKYRMTDEMKGVLWSLVTLSNECCRLENEKNALESSTVQVSEQGLRKVLYQKIVAAFPEGWMSSGQISRDVSSMKKKYEKEAMEGEP